MPSSTTLIWHPYMDKSAFVGAVGFNSICQGMQEMSHEPMHCVIGTSLSPTWWSCRGPWTSSRPSWLQSRNLGEHYLRQSPVVMRAFVEFQVSSREILSQCWSKKNISSDAFKRVRGIGSHYLHHLFLNGTHLSVKRDILTCNFSCQRKWEHVNEYLAFLAVQDIAKEAHFSYWLQCPESWPARLGGERKLRDWQIGFLEGIKRL